jgi:hypothetical protein
MCTCCAVTCCVMQARAVIDGLPADVVALALPLDVQKIADAGLLREDWRKMYPLQSVGTLPKHILHANVCWGRGGWCKTLEGASRNCVFERTACSKVECRAHTV